MRKRGNIERKDSDLVRLIKGEINSKEYVKIIEKRVYDMHREAVKRDA